MPGINRVIISGRVGAAPDIHRGNSGDPIANFSVATSDKWRDKNSGEMREKTEWHKIVVFGKAAEIVEKYVGKGHRIGIVGKLRTRKWQDKNGQDRYTTEVVVQNGHGQVDLQQDKLIDGNQSSGNQNSSSGSGGKYTQSHDDIDDEIPF